MSPRLTRDTLRTPSLPVDPVETTPRRQRSKRRHTKANTPARSALSRYLSDIRDQSKLTREEEVELAARIAAGDDAALNRLVESNLQFVVKIAAEYNHMGLPLEDLVNEGNLGLIEAARRFDPQRGTRFISWAVWWIRKTICQALSDNCQVVRLPVSQLRKMRVVRGIEASLTRELGREPTDDELVAQLPPDLQHLDPIHRYGLRLSSIDEPTGEDQTDTVADRLPDTEHVHVDQTIAHRQALASVTSQLARLDQRQQAVLAHRFGLAGGRALTLEEIGRTIGRSREGVRLIERKALDQLRRGITARTAPRTRPVVSTRLDSTSNSNTPEPQAALTA